MKAAPLYPDRTLPIVPNFETDVEILEPVQWAKEHADWVQSLASHHGVVLLRGLNASTPSEFRAICHGIEPNLRNYVGGDSPRTGVTDQVYTSTEYDADLEVLLHNELSYAGWSPRLVFFGCITPALTGGETQVADGREIYQAMPPRLRDRFERRGVAYLQHLWDAEGSPGIGKSWQETFETSDRAEVEAYLKNADMDYTWSEFGIRTKAVHSAVMVHPETGDKCWRNQADQWHRGFKSVKTSIGDIADPRFDPSTSGEETLGNHVTYGDGSEIELEDLETVRAVNRSKEVVFPWRAGDIMVIDNILAMHGRKPYRGPRQVLVAMA